MKSTEQKPSWSDKLVSTLKELNIYGQNNDIFNPFRVIRDVSMS